MSNEIIEGFRLSPQQTQLLETAAGEVLSFHGYCLVRIDGNLRPEKFLRSLQQVMDRHEILRTSFARVPGMEMPLQVIGGKGLEVAFDVLAWVDADDADYEAAVEKLLERESKRIFDLEHGPLVRTTLVRLAAGRHIALLSAYAGCSDVAGLRAVLEEVSACYAGSLEDLPVHNYQYADFAEWHNELLESADCELGAQYWEKHVGSGFLPSTLPSTRQLDGGQFRPRFVKRTIGSGTLAALDAVLAEYQIQMSSFLLSCWRTLIWLLNGRQECILGVACDGRKYDELKRTPGLFSRHLPERIPIVPSLPFLELVQQSEASKQEMERWQEYWKRPAGSYLPLCYEFIDLGEGYSTAGVKFTVEQEYVCYDRFDVKLVCVRQGEKLWAELHYDSARYTREQMERLGERYAALVSDAVLDPKRAVSELPMLGEAERRQVLEQWSRNEREYEGRESSVPERVARQAREHPEALAVECGEKRLSYGELNRRANQIAAGLRRRGAGRETLVGLCVERSLEMVAGILGILKAGAAYLPLDPSYPAERLAYMLEDSGARLILSTQQEQGKVAGEGREVLLLEGGEWDEYAGQEPGVEIAGEQLAYVIYTSGSTGRPKGVGVEHRQLSNYVEGISERLELRAGMRYGMVSTYAADLGYTMLFPGLCQGGSLDVIAGERVLDGEALAEHWGPAAVDCLKIVPSHLEALLNQAPEGSLLPRKWLVMGGAASSWELVERVRKLGGECRVLNHYGPTETTVGVLTYEASGQSGERGPGRTVPLGRPLGNAEVYVLDQEMGAAGIEVEGEIYIGGKGLARGYVGQAALTAERFVPNPYSGRGGERLYRSGDRGRWLESGEVEFLGRRDEQVKVRGYRVELGEIEEALKSHPQVREAVVLAWGEGEQEKRLQGYVVLRQAGAQLAGEELQRYLREKVPEHMVPAGIVVMEAMPLTANGKIDRQGLPGPEKVAGGRQKKVGAQTPVEEMVAGLWCEVLKREQVGVEENFFELGGHSLLATQVVSRLRGVFGIELPLRALFEAPTVAGLGQRVEQALRQGSRSEMPALLPVSREQGLPLSFAQQRLWFIDQLEPNSSLYNLNAAVRMRGELHLAALEQAMTALVERHEALRTRIPLDEVDGEPVQVIEAHSSAHLLREDLTCWNDDAVRERKARERLQEEAKQPYDLRNGPLVRMLLLCLGNRDHILFLGMHHIVSDGWSMGILVREFTALYGAFRQGDPSPLAKPPIHYADFAVWQREWLQGPVLEKQLSYWCEQLDGLPAAMDLPADYPRPHETTFRAESQSFEIPEELAGPLRMLCRQEGATLFMAFLAAFSMLLRYYSGQEDIAIGTSVANRNLLETEALVGFFVNQLTLRCDLSGDPTFIELLARVRETALGAYVHQDLPFEKLVSTLRPERALNRSPLFQVKYEFDPDPPVLPTLVDVDVSIFDLKLNAFRNDLHLMIQAGANGLNGTIVYDRNLFLPARIVCLTEHYKLLLRCVGVNPSANLSATMKSLAGFDLDRQEEFKRRHGAVFRGRLATRLELTSLNHRT